MEYRLTLTGAVSLESPTRGSRRLQYCFLWYGEEPKLPPSLTGLPNVTIREAEHDPASFKNDISVRSGSMIYPDESKVRLFDPVSSPFGTIGCFAMLEGPRS